MGDLHKILVPAGYLVGEYGSNMAWKKGDEAIYFEVSGSGNGQIEREITVLTLFKSGNQIWSSRHIKVDSNKIYVFNDEQQWVQLYTQTTDQAVHAPSSSPKPTTNNDLHGSPGAARSERITSQQTTQSTGSVNHSLVETFKTSWRDEGWRHKPKSEQAEAITLMVLIVQTDIKSPADQQATLDYIQRTIDSW